MFGLLVGMCFSSDEAGCICIMDSLEVLVSKSPN